MALSLLEIADLHDDRGTLFRRVKACCGVLCRQILDNPSSSAPMIAWAQGVRADTDGSALAVWKGIVTDPAVISLTRQDLDAGALPSDADLLAVVTALLAKFA